jgi:hypothetical protein
MNVAATSEEVAGRLVQHAEPVFKMPGACDSPYIHAMKFVQEIETSVPDD